MATREQVLDYLLDEEPTYRIAAEALGVEALEVLAELVVAADPLLASKATRLASEIGSPRAWEVIERAAARERDPTVRVAAASALRRLAARDPGHEMAFADEPNGLLDRLLADEDAGVRKFALKAAWELDLRDRLERVASDVTEVGFLRESAAEMLSRGR